MDAKRFKYTKPTELTGRGKTRVNLFKGEISYASVLIVQVDGHNNLHSHRHHEGTWFVLKGRARFYTADDEIVGEFGPYEGILIPRNFPYWFESCSGEDLEILQIEATDGPEGDDEARDRVDYTPRRSEQNVTVIDAK